MAIVTAFAVAMALLMPAPNVEAAPGESTANPVEPGATITVAPLGSAARDAQDDVLIPAEGNPITTGTTGLVTFTIIGNGSVTGSTFVAGGGTTLLCGPNASCDAIPDPSGDSPDTAATAGVQVKVKVGDTSASKPGEFYVRMESGNTTQILTVHVSKAAVPTKVTVKAADSSIPASGDPSTKLTITVTDASNKGIAGHKVRIYTTNGVFVDDLGSTVTYPGVGAANTGAAIFGVPLTATPCTNRGGCDVITRLGATEADVDHDADSATEPIDVTIASGTAVVSIKGAGRPGVATITALAENGVSGSETVVLAGVAKAISAAADQDSVQATGTVYIVVNIADSTGNPVKGATVENLKAEAPSDNDRPVTVIGQERPKGTNGSKKAIPACGESATDGDGNCALAVSAGSSSSPATRGVHTVSFDGPGTIAKADRTVTVDIAVAGKPVSVTHDAPERVDTLSTTKITLTARDDEGNLVGAVKSRVEQIEGGGTILNEKDGDADTSNGARSFEYFAPSRPGLVTFFVSVGTGADAVKETITVQIGEEAMEEPDEPEMPAMPESEPTLTVTHSLGIFSGGSATELIDAADAACPGGAWIWLQDAGGEWRNYRTSAPAFVNAVFIAALPGDLGQRAVFVRECAGDAMSDEG